MEIEKSELVRLFVNYLIQYGRGMEKFAQAYDAKDGEAKAIHLTDGIESVVDTQIEPLRMHATYILQQQVSPLIGPMSIPTFMEELYNSHPGEVNSAISMITSNLDDGRELFYIIEGNNFDMGSINVQRILLHRLDLALKGHHRKIPQNCIEEYLNSRYNQV